MPYFDALIQVLERERRQLFTPEEIGEKRKEAPAIVPKQILKKWPRIYAEDADLKRPQID